MCSHPESLARSRSRTTAWAARRPPGWLVRRGSLSTAASLPSHTCGVGVLFSCGRVGENGGGGGAFTRTDNAVKNRYMAICKKVDRDKDKGKGTPRRYSRAETVSRGSSALSTPVGTPCRRCALPAHSLVPRLACAPEPVGVSVQISNRDLGFRLDG
jgi:hypothetical protein